jgi:NADH-quinone oxidoreductase subunit L
MSRTTSAEGWALMLYALIPLLPLIAFLILGLAGAHIKTRAHLIAVPAVDGIF